MLNAEQAAELASVGVSSRPGDRILTALRSAEAVAKLSEFLWIEAFPYRKGDDHYEENDHKQTESTADPGPVKGLWPIAMRNCARNCGGSTCESSENSDAFAPSVQGQ